jgi:hypothetical protein
MKELHSNDTSSNQAIQLLFDILACTDLLLLLAIIENRMPTRGATPELKSMELEFQARTNKVSTLSEKTKSRF